MTNKWRRRARKWRKEARAYKGYYIDTDLALKTERIQNALAGPASGAAAALNKAEELRDAVGREHEAFMQANDESEKLQMQVRDMDVRFSYLDKSGPAEIEKLKTALYEANKGVCLWRGKDYNASRELKNIVAENIRLDSTLTKEKVYHESAVSERNTALQKVAELRQDVLRLSTELARVQGVCEATQAQVLKHSATIVNLRERENEALKESEGLLAWQRRVREACSARDERKGMLTDMSVAYWHALVTAIHSEPVEPKEET